MNASDLQGIKDTEEQVSEVVNTKKLTEEELRDKLQIIVPGLYPDWRKNQFEVIQQVHNSNKKFIAIQAGTGFGKSAEAVSSCIVGTDRGIILTGTKQLGEQYYNDFYSIGLKTVKGRGNFSCTIIPEKTADAAPCRAGMKCMYKGGGCAYYDQKIIATESNLTSMNIHYFLYEANFGGDFSGVNTLFIDEAHKLESVIQDFIEIRLSFERFADEGQPLPPPGNRNISNLQEWTENVYGTIEAELNQILEELEEDPTNEIATLRAIRLSAAKGNLDKFKNVDETWIIEEDKFAVVLKPVWIAKYLNQVLFKHANRIVLMSATLPRTIMENLGITDYEYINVPPTFDIKNRPIIWIPAANLARSAENPDMEMKKLVSINDALCDKHINDKGMIHTVNYRIAEYIKNNSKHASRIITHRESGDREKILEEFKASKTNSILMSPSFTEGVDLPYDQCRFQVICKIPYGDLNNKQIKARMSSDPAWYATGAIVTLVQTYGRIMRAEDDSGITYILDSSLLNLINRWRVVFDQLTGFLDALFISEKGKNIPFNEYINITKPRSR